LRISGRKPDLFGHRISPDWEFNFTQLTSVNILTQKTILQNKKGFCVEKPFCPATAGLFFIFSLFSFFPAPEGAGFDNVHFLPPSIYIALVKNPSMKSLPQL